MKVYEFIRKNNYCLLKGPMSGDWSPSYEPSWNDCCTNQTGRSPRVIAFAAEICDIHVIFLIDSVRLATNDQTNIYWSFTCRTNLSVFDDQFSE